MGPELLEECPTQIKTYTQVFEENFPFYISIGMSASEYWEGDPCLTQYYRKAYLLKQEEINNNAWLQGLYVYDAVTTALHNALRGFGKQRLPAKDYAKQPYDLRGKVKSEVEKAKEIEIEQEKAAAWMENFVRMNQKK